MVLLACRDIQHMVRLGVDVVLRFAAHVVVGSCLAAILQHMEGLGVDEVL